MDIEENIVEYKIQNNSDVEGSVISAAKAHYSQGNYREALKLLLDATHTNSDSDIYVDIGSCYYMLNERHEAINYWNKALELDSKNSKAYTNLGNLEYKIGNIEKAISFWLVALISRPEDANTSLNLAIAFNQKNMRFESIKYFEKYLKYAEDKDSESYIKIQTRIQDCQSIANQYLAAGVQLHTENQDKQAAACYFKALANYPNLSKANLNLGSIFFSDKNLELAIKYWKNSSHIDPSYEKIYSNLAISYDLQKQFDYAYCYYNRYMNYIYSNKEEYSKANRRILQMKPFLKEHPELIQRHLELAENHLANNEIYDAIDEFTNYSILNPEEHKKYKEMIKKLESYLEPELEIIASCFDIGNKLISEGRYSDAKSYFYRIMVLSSPKYLEFSKARAKYAQCEKSELGRV